MQRLEAAWREAVFALYLGEEKIAPEVVENMRSWPHSGFSVDHVIERILRHCGLWNVAPPRPPPDGDGPVYVPDDVAEATREVRFVDMDTFWETF